MLLRRECVTDFSRATVIIASFWISGSCLKVFPNLRSNNATVSDGTRLAMRRWKTVCSYGDVSSVNSGARHSCCRHEV